MTESAITKLSLTELRKMKGRTRADAPEGPELGPEFWERAEVSPSPRKVSVHLRVDPDILDFFKQQGKGHLTRMNTVLRAYVDAKKSS